MPVVYAFVSSDWRRSKRRRVRIAHLSTVANRQEVPTQCAMRTLQCSISSLHYLHGEMLFLG